MARILHFIYISIGICFVFYELDLFLQGFVLSCAETNTISETSFTGFSPEWCWSFWPGCTKHT